MSIINSRPIGAGEPVHDAVFQARLPIAASRRPCHQAFSSQ
jgi:hypothetical protein